MRKASLANRGRPFEDLLNLAHSRYQASGQACVHKVPTEFLPLRDCRGQITSCKVEHKSCVDYLGRYYNIPVAVEAKHTEDGRIRFDRVEQHQAEYLDDFCRSPAAVGLVVVSFSMRRFFAVPWPFWRAGREAWANCPRRGAKGMVEEYGAIWWTPGQASVSPELLLPEWEIKQGGKFVLPYLDIINNLFAGRDKPHGAE